MSFRYIGLSLTLAGVLGVAMSGSLLAGCGSDSGGSQIEQGKQAVSTRQCSTCHGAPDGSLSGQTTPQPKSMAYPPNITPDPDTGIGEWDTQTIVNAILNGVDDEGATLCSPMPKFGTQGMTTDEATAIAEYLKSLPPVSREVPESMCAEKGGS